MKRKKQEALGPVKRLRHRKVDFFREEPFSLNSCENRMLENRDIARLRRLKRTALAPFGALPFGHFGGKMVEQKLAVTASATRSNAGYRTRRRQDFVNEQRHKEMRDATRTTARSYVSD